MKATFEDKTPKFNLNHRAEKHFCSQYTAVVIFDGKTAYDAVTLRIYATDAKCYCCIWTADNCKMSGRGGDMYYRSGSGSVGGYGYHRASAAAQEAICNAGITLSEDIAGRGDEAIAEAVRAIAAAIWKDGYYNYIHITKAHA